MYNYARDNFKIIIEKKKRAKHYKIKGILINITILKGRVKKISKIRYCIKFKTDV